MNKSSEQKYDFARGTANGSGQAGVGHNPLVIYEHSAQITSQMVETQQKQTMMMSEAHTIMLEQIEGTRSVNALPSALIELHKFVERTARRAQAADKEGTSVDEEIQKSFANFMHCMVKVVQSFADAERSNGGGAQELRQFDARITSEWFQRCWSWLMNSKNSYCEMKLDRAFMPHIVEHTLRSEGAVGADPLTYGLPPGTERSAPRPNRKYSEWPPLKQKKNAGDGKDEKKGGDDRTEVKNESNGQSRGTKRKGVGAQSAQGGNNSNKKPRKKDATSAGSSSSTAASDASVASIGASQSITDGAKTNSGSGNGGSSSSA